MTRFDEVARLRELEKKEDGDWSYITRENGDGIAHIWGSDGDEVAEVYDNPGLDISEEDRAQFILSAKDDLPWILEAAACFQPGDAERIDRIAREDLLEGCCGQCDADIDMMHRLRRAAVILEELE